MRIRAFNNKTPKTDAANLKSKLLRTPGCYVLPSHRMRFFVGVLFFSFYSGNNGCLLAANHFGNGLDGATTYVHNMNNGGIKNKFNVTRVLYHQRIGFISVFVKRACSILLCHTHISSTHCISLSLSISFLFVFVFILRFPFFLVLSRRPRTFSVKIFRTKIDAYKRTNVK